MVSLSIYWRRLLMLASFGGLSSVCLLPVSACAHGRVLGSLSSNMGLFQSSVENSSLCRSL
jgi:hypothetical protein